MSKKIECPLCGKINKRVNLEETGGKLLCKYCGCESVIVDIDRDSTPSVYISPCDFEKSLK